MPVEIRSATLADLADLTALLVAQLRDHGNDLADSALAAAAAGMLERPRRGQFLLASEGGRAVGFAALSYLWTLERGGWAAWLDELFVVPERRGDGIGDALLAAALAAAAAAGARAVDLEIEAGHERAASLYRRHGFTPLARRRWARALASPPTQTPPTPATLGGACACGAVRYVVSAAPLEVVHCHCAMCQRASGAPLVTWATVPSAAFRFERGAPRERRSSAQARRTFCADCGSPLTFRLDAQPDRLDVTVATLDDPEAVRPSEHVFTVSQRSWLTVEDDLPRRRDGGA